MKVIFLEDVPPSSRAGDVKEVKDGYGRNFLLPRKLAVLATSDALQRAGSLRAEAESRRINESKDWSEVAQGLKQNPITIEMKSGPTGRLYGSVTTTQIAEQLTEITGRSISRRGVRMATPIREIGEFTVSVRLFEDVVTDVKVVVRGDSNDTEDSVVEPEGEEEGERKSDSSASSNGPGQEEQPSGDDPVLESED